MALAGAGSFSAKGFSCDVVDEDWSGTVRITTRCTGPAGTRLNYTAVG